MWKILSVNKKGFLLLEVLVVSSIMLLVLSALFFTVLSSVKLSSAVKKNIIASNLVQETAEALRDFRDKTDWNVDGLGTLPTHSSYHMEVQLSAWAVVLGEETVNGFTRYFYIGDVSRDLSGNIESVYNPSNHDNNTKKINSIVALGGKETQISIYLTNWK